MERYDQINGDQMYLDERRIRFDKNEAKVQLIVSGNILLAYVNDTALTTRCYSLQDGGIGLFVECGGGILAGCGVERRRRMNWFELNSAALLSDGRSRAINAENPTGEKGNGGKELPVA